MIGTFALGRGSLRTRRSFRVGVVAGVGLPVLVLAVFSVLPRGGSSTGEAVSPEVAAQRQAFSDFDEALGPIIADGAATVVYGMRPGINDIYDARFDAAALTAMAEGWVGAMERVREEFAQVEVPAFLWEVADLYAASFDSYVKTARRLHAAAQVSGEQRAQGVTRAAEHGTEADDLYDAAQAELERHRGRLGLAAPGK